MPWEEEEEKPLPKSEVKKVDDATLKQRMDQDKEVRTLREEKERIANMIQDQANKESSEEQLMEEALQMVQ